MIPKKFPRVLEIQGSGISDLKYPIYQHYHEEKIKKVDVGVF